MKKILGIVLLLIIVLFLYFCYFKYIEKVDYVALGPYKLVLVSSDTMRPQIVKGDAIMIKEEAEYKVDDIVCYEAYSVLQTRRITSLDTKITVRENYTGAEDEIEGYQIIGKMQYKIPFLGSILTFLTQPFTFLFMGILIGAYFVFVYNKKTP